MAESGYVWNGLVAGTVAGLVLCALTYLTLPTTEEVIEETRRLGVNIPMHSGAEDIIAAALAISGIVAFILTILIGVVFGTIHEILDRKIGNRLPPIFTALVAGMILTALLVVPNVALGASTLKIAVNGATGLSYTMTLMLLSKIRNPRQAPSMKKQTEGWVGDQT